MRKTWCVYIYICIWKSCTIGSSLKMTGPANNGFLINKWLQYCQSFSWYNFGASPLLFGNIRWNLSMFILMFRESFSAVIKMSIIVFRVFFCKETAVFWTTHEIAMAVAEGCGLTGLLCCDTRPTGAIQKLKSLKFEMFLVKKKHYIVR